MFKYLLPELKDDTEFSSQFINLFTRAPSPNQYICSHDSGSFGLADLFHLGYGLVSPGTVKGNPLVT